MSDEVRLGRYRHFKGHDYIVIAVARDCKNPENQVVVYEALHATEKYSYGQVWTRSLEDFFREVNVGVN